MNADASVTVVFQDEVHYQVQTSVTAKWVPKGSKPKVMSKPGKQNVAYSGYLIPDTGELIVNKPSWFNYETVIEDCLAGRIDLILTKSISRFARNTVDTVTTIRSKKASVFISRRKTSIPLIQRANFF